MTKHKKRKKRTGQESGSGKYSGTGGGGKTWRDQLTESASSPTRDIDEALARVRMLTLNELSQIACANEDLMNSVRTEADLLAGIRAASDDDLRGAVAIALGWPAERVAALDAADLLTIAERFAEANWKAIAAHYDPVLDKEIMDGLRRLATEGPWIPQPLRMRPTASELRQLRKVKI